MVEREISIQAEATLSDAELERIAHARARIDYGPPDMQYAVAPTMWRAVGWVGDESVAHAGIVQREVTVGGRTLDVGGISSGWTLPEYRGQGLAGDVLRAVQRFLGEVLGVEFGFLLCREHVVTFYTAPGWKRVDDLLIFHQPTGPMTWPLVVMVLPLIDQPWPSGPIDLCGLPW